jgi:fructose-bisphosphate aldolase class II
MPVAVWGAMFRELAEGASVPVVAHLDHGLTVGDAQAAIAAGFTSVMIDGSALPLEENIALTAEVAALAHAAGVSCEGELGVVGYAGGKASTGTDPEEAAKFVRETGLDALAVSVGNLHLQQGAGQGLDLGLIRRIEAATAVPLVIHGGSGVPVEQRSALAAGSRIAKFNIGTELRMAFGAALRAAVAQDPGRFDRIAILRETEEPLMRAAQAVIRGLGASGRAG